MTYNEDSSATPCILAVIITECSLAIVINVILFTVLIRLKTQLSGWGFGLITCIAISDVLSASITLAVCCIRFNPSSEFIIWYCPLFSFTRVIYGICGLILSLLAIDRYCLICHKVSFPKVWPWGLIILLGLFMLGGLLGCIYYDSFLPDASHLFCNMNIYRWSVVVDVMFRVLANLPLVILTFSYIAIFVKGSILNKPGEELISKRVAIRALVLLALYNICYLPKFINSVTIVLNQPCPYIFVLFTPIGLAGVNIINPILALALNQSIRSELLNLMSLSSRSPSPQNLV